MRKIINIEKKKIGIKQPVFLIAEVGSNHNRDKNTVKKLIDCAAKAGFDAVKFQIYDAKEAFSANETTKDVKLDHLYGLKPWWEVVRDIILMPREWFQEMFKYVRAAGMIPLSAIHRAEDCRFLLDLGLPAIKIASIDLTYYQLLKKLVQFKLPMIVSTGMGQAHEISKTMGNLKNWGQRDVVLLHCVSCYPPKPEEVNLNNILNFKSLYNIPIGLSDHSDGVATSIASVALGVNVIEKHVTLDKSYPGPDHSFALEPNEMIRLVKEVREVEKSLGYLQRKLSKREIENRKMIRRSLIAKVAIKKGETINVEKIKFARPGTGIPTYEFNKAKGCRAKCDIEPETIIKWNMLINK